MSTCNSNIALLFELSVESKKTSKSAPLFVVGFGELCERGFDQLSLHFTSLRTDDLRAHSTPGNDNGGGKSALGHGLPQGMWATGSSGFRKQHPADRKRSAPEQSTSYSTRGAHVFGIVDALSGLNASVAVHCKAQVLVGTVLCILCAVKPS